MSELAATPNAVAGRSWGSALRGGRPMPYALGVVLLAALYAGAAHVGYALEVAGPVAAIVWLPVGVGIAFLHLRGLQFWPGVLVGDLLVNDYDALPLGTALGQTAGNLLEVILATLLLARWARGSPLGSVAGVSHMLAALAAGTAVSATIGSLAQVLGGVIEPEALPTVWRTWWLGDSIGALVLVPLAIAWCRRPPRDWLKGRVVEATVLSAAVVGVTLVTTRTDQPFAYLIFPALIWAALRFGQRGGTLAVAVAVALTVWNASHYLGGFVFRSVSNTVVDTQLFIGIAALTTLFLAAVVAEREAFAEGLRASRARLVEASDVERRRLLRNLHDGVQQRLTALVVRLRFAADEQPLDRDESAALIERAGTEVTLAIEELRQLAHGLQPALLAHLGLAGAIRGLAAGATVPVTVVELPAARFDDGVETTAYYVVAEAVTNAQRYAAATSIRVRLTARHDVLRVEVVDDGIGGAAEGPGSGLEGLHDRVDALGGSFAVESGARGTRVTARIPATVAG